MDDKSYPETARKRGRPPRPPKPPPKCTCGSLRGCGVHSGKDLSISGTVDYKVDVPNVSAVNRFPVDTGVEKVNNSAATGVEKVNDSAATGVEKQNNSAAVGVEKVVPPLASDHEEEINIDRDSGSDDGSGSERGPVVKKTRMLGVGRREKTGRAVFLGSRLKTSLASLSESEAMVKDLNRRLKDAESRNSLYAQSKDSDVNEVLRLSTKVTGLESEVASLNLKITEQEAICSQLRSELMVSEKTASEVVNLRLKISEQEALISEFRSELRISEENASQIGPLRSKITALVEKHTDLEYKVDTYKRMVSGLENQLNIRASAYSRLLGDFKEAQVEKEVLNGKLVTVTSDLEKVRGRAEWVLTEYKKPFNDLGRHQKCGRLNHLISTVDNMLVNTEPSMRSIESSELFGALFKQHPHLYSGFASGTLTPEDDVEFTEKFGISQHKRKDMKSWLIQRNMDFLAPSNKVDTHRKNISVAKYFKFEMCDVNDNGTVEKVPGVYTANLEVLLTERVQRLANAGKLNLDGDFGEKLFCCILGDKGGESTKLGLLIANVNKANSFSNISILSIYNGPDSMPYVHELLKGVADQFNKLTKVTVGVDGVEKQIEIEKFITGDMMFLCAVYGHAGPCSTYYCIFCETTGVRLSQMGSRSTERTLSSMRCQSMLQGDASKGMRMRPLFDIEPSHIVPSCLHIFLGLANDFLEKVEVFCLQEDCEGITDVEIRKRSDILNAKKSVERDITKQKETLKVFEGLKRNAEIVFSVMQAIVEKKIIPNDVDEAKCDKECLYIDKRMNSFPGENAEWIQCEHEICEKWYHFPCAGLIDFNEVAAAKNDFSCYDCEGKDMSVLAIEVSQYMDLLRDKEKEVKRSLSETELKLTKLRETIDQHLGPCYQRYQDQLKKMGISQAAYFQKLNGNDVRKLLTNGNPRLFTSVFKKQNDDIEVLIKAMEVLGDIQDYTAARFFTDQEISRFEDLVYTFRGLIEKLYAKDTTRNREKQITPKTHWLIAHVLPFLKKFKCWGLMSEQGGEAMHCKINALERRLFCLNKNLEKKLLHIVELMNIQNRIHDSKVLL